MDFLLHFFLPYLLLYKYEALFVIVFFAAIILPLPVSALLLAVGAFSSQGYFNFWASLATAQAANVLGDLVDYSLTRKYGYAVIKKLKIDKSRFYAQLKQYLISNAGLTIFVTRLAGSLDPLGSFLSGLVGIRFITFLFYDFLGNFLEMATVISLGYSAGSQWENFSNLLTIIGEIFVVAIIIFVLIRIYRRLTRPRNETR